MSKSRKRFLHPYAAVSIEDASFQSVTAPIQIMMSHAFAAKKKKLICASVHCLSHHVQMIPYARLQ